MPRYGTVDKDDGLHLAAPEEVDGRRLRREQNRDAVLDALLALFREGHLTPGIHEVARRAGISPRSVFRYFDDVEDLTRAAIERQAAEARPLLDLGVGADAPTPDKIEHVVEARLRLYEVIAPGARVARACAHRQPVVAAQLHETRTFLRRQLRLLFAPELGGQDATRLPAIDALCSFETYELLRAEQGLSRARTAAVLRSALQALLATDAVTA
ncbi:MAG: TetR/AcrR family transcriptional regulator [Acidimicrobiia bacterium]|nr:TetR/AcrR family transcriptional regulator [Acidimicrobiia bacterium]